METPTVAQVAALPVIKVEELAGWLRRLDKAAELGPGLPALVDATTALCDFLAAAGVEVSPSASAERVALLLEEFSRTTARLVADWAWPDFVRVEAGLPGDGEAWPYNHIDWVAAADELRAAYQPVIFAGKMFAMR